jgi:hypothetical protein
MATFFSIISTGSFEWVDSMPVGDGDSYSFSFELAFDNPTTTGIPLTVTPLNLEIAGMAFGMNLRLDAGEVPFGTYLAGTEVFSPSVEILGPGTQILGVAGFDFYFRAEDVPVEIATGDTGGSLLAEGLIVDFHPTWTTQVLGYERAIGVSDVEVVPEPSVSLLMIVSLFVCLWRHRN